MKNFILQKMKVEKNEKKTYKLLSFALNFENFQIKTRRKDIDCILEYSHHCN